MVIGTWLLEEDIERAKNPMIRQATHHDIPAIARVHTESWRSTYRGQVPDAYLDNLCTIKSQTGWTARFEDMNGRAFVAEVDGEIVGFADFGPTRDTDKAKSEVAELYAIYLLHPAQGRGFGRQLFEQGVSWALASDFQELTTLVLDSNAAARRFYERMGMLADGFKIAASIGGKDVCELRYTRSIE